MLFKEVTAVYSENIRNPQIQNIDLVSIKEDGTYIYH
jgi:hypothetical protein